jgi:hypothetical protein
MNIGEASKSVLRFSDEDLSLRERQTNSGGLEKRFQLQDLFKLGRFGAEFHFTRSSFGFSMIRISILLDLWKSTERPGSEAKRPANSTIRRVFFEMRS